MFLQPQQFLALHRDRNLLIIKLITECGNIGNRLTIYQLVIFEKGL
jgi:hypothetical protein